MEGYVNPSPNNSNLNPSLEKQSEAQAFAREMAQNIWQKFNFNEQIEAVMELRKALVEVRAATLKSWSEERDAQAKTMDEIAKGNEYLK